jgi:hypothetical protein
MALLIERVVHLSMNGAEFLQRLHASEPLHGVFSSSKRLMRMLRAIVEPTTDLLAYVFIARLRNFSAAALSRADRGYRGHNAPPAASPRPSNANSAAAPRSNRSSDTPRP